MKALTALTVLAAQGSGLMKYTNGWRNGMILRPNFKYLWLVIIEFIVRDGSALVGLGCYRSAMSSL